MSERIFKKTSWLPCTAADAFAWHDRPGAFERLNPPWMQVKLVSHPNCVREGSRAVIEQRVGVIRSEWVVEHFGCEPGLEFRDRMLRGPFAEWIHVHRFSPAADAGCELQDDILYKLPFGKIGALAGGAMVEKQLRQLFDYRHALTSADLTDWKRHAHLPRMRVLVCGASGFVGSALVSYLTTQGHSVLRLVRRKAKNDDEIGWPDPKVIPDLASAGRIDAIINLAGENIASERWSTERKKRILESRVHTTRALVQSMQAMPSRPDVFLSASATGFYGDRADGICSEESASGTGFLADVCRQWEDAAAWASELGVRTVMLRFGVVLSPAGGALAKMLPAFRAGLGGRLGSGRQWFGWVTIDDLLGATGFALYEPSLSGPVNVVAPEMVCQKAFAQVLAKVLRRPTFAPVPAFALKWMMGEMADEMLLSGSRVVPAKLLQAGYDFRHENLEHGLRHLLGRTV